MAHELIAIESVCEQICALREIAETSDEERDPQITLIDVSREGVSTSQPITEELLKIHLENDLKNDVHDTSLFASKRGTVRCVHLKYPEIPSDGRPPMLLTGSSFTQLSLWLRIPKIFLDVLASGTTTFLNAMPNLPPLCSESSGQADLHYLSFILQFNLGGSRSTWFSASFTYHFQSRRTYIFLQSLKNSSLTAAHQTPLTQAIDKSSFWRKERANLLLPSAMIRTHLQARLRSLNEKHNQIYELECKMGIRHDHHAEVDYRSLDFSSIFREIGSLNSNLAWSTHSCKITRRLLDFMDSIAVKYKRQAIANGFTEDEAIEVELTLLDAHAYLRSWNTSLVDRMEYLSKRLQALSQSVYSGIAQRDSANSISLAATSTKLAESSQRVAIATSRDSAVMRVIGAVTVVFLPGTFTATFFSTTFFNFGDGINGKVYSSWLWLYFVLTIGLTAVVLGGTWYLWRTKERELQMHVDDKEASKLKQV